MDKQRILYPYKGLLFRNNKKNEVLILVTIGITWKYHVNRKNQAENHIEVCFYVKCQT
jgi:hypothetical protein